MHWPLTVPVCPRLLSCSLTSSFMQTHSLLWMLPLSILYHSCWLWLRNNKVTAVWNHHHSNFNPTIQVPMSRRGWSNKSCPWLRNRLLSCHWINNTLSWAYAISLLHRSDKSNIVREAILSAAILIYRISWHWTQVQGMLSLITKLPVYCNKSGTQIPVAIHMLAQWLHSAWFSLYSTTVRWLRWYDKRRSFYIQTFLPWMEQHRGNSHLASSCHCFPL